MKELLEEEARNAKDVTDIIEEERSKLDARTPINEEVFRAWHKAKMDAKRKAREEADSERRKKGMLNGREIFQQVHGVVRCAGKDALWGHVHVCLRVHLWRPLR